MSQLLPQATLLPQASPMKPQESAAPQTVVVGTHVRESTSHTDPALHVPQLSIPPHRSLTVPHWMPRLAQVGGTQPGMPPPPLVPALPPPTAVPAAPPFPPTTGVVPGPVFPPACPPELTPPGPGPPFPATPPDPAAPPAPAGAPDVPPVVAVVPPQDARVRRTLATTKSGCARCIDPLRPG